MDALTALSLAASVVQFVDFSSRLIKSSKEIYNQRLPDPDTRSLSLKLQSLKPMLDRCQETVSLLSPQGSAGPLSSPPDVGAALIGTLGDAMDNLRRDLTSAEQELFKRGYGQSRHTLGWKVRSRIYQNDKDKTAKATRHSRETVELFDSFEIVRNIANRFVTRKTDPLLSIKGRDHKVLDWLTNFDYGKRHVVLSRTRAEGTGDWLISDPVFQSWSARVANLSQNEIATQNIHREREPVELRSTIQTDAVDKTQKQPLSEGISIEENICKIDAGSRMPEKLRPHTVLWCCGMPGSGKSVLMSHMVDHLLAKVNTEGPFAQRSRVAYFYFDFRVKISPREALASLLKQLCIQSGIVSSALIQMWQAGRNVGLGTPTSQQPDTTELLAMLLDYITKFRQTYICLDALDECASEYQDSLHEIIQRLIKSPCSLLVTSRALTTYIELFSEFPRINVKASGDDIKSYVKAFVERNTELADIVSETLQDQIADVIFQKSDGMFLSATLLMQQLVNQTSIFEIRETLSTIPGNLHDIYQNVLQGIRAQPANRSKLAMRILMWLSYSVRTLTVPELQHALAIDIDTYSFNPERLPPERIIEEVCMGLLTIDQDRGIVLLSHASLEHYLVDLRKDLFSNGEKEIALSCLAYMNIRELASPCEMDAHYANRVKVFPLSVYIAQHWGSHMIDYWQPEIRDRVYDFWNRPRRVEAFTQLLYIGNEVTFTDCRGYPILSPLHIAAFFGMLEATKSILAVMQTTSDIMPESHCMEQESLALHGVSIGMGLTSFQTDSWGRTALHIACERGHTEVAAALQGHWFLVDAKDRYGKSALHYACIRGNISIVRDLLRRGASVVNVDGDGKTPIDGAAENGHTSIVEELVRNNAAESNALSFAAAAGHLEIVSILLDAGYDTQEDEALLKAAKAGFEDVVGILLERGAYLDTKDQEQGMTALHYAASEGRTAMVKLLLLNGCDIQIRDSTGRTALYLAAEKGDEPTVRALVESGAEIEARTHQGRTPLTESAATGNVGVVEFLLRRGASIGSNSSNDSSMASKGNDTQENALQLACRHGHLSVVRLLLEKYSDPNNKGATGKAPISYAVQEGHAAVVELLLTIPGVDPNAQDNRGRAALSYAAQNGHSTVVQSLCAYGADVNAKDSYGRSALSYASQEGHNDIVLYLWAAGAEMNQSDSYEKAAFSNLAHNGTKPLAKALQEPSLVDAS